MTSRGPIRAIVRSLSRSVSRYGDIAISPRWRLSGILDLLDACLDYPRIVLDGLIRVLGVYCNFYRNLQRVYEVVYFELYVKSYYLTHTQFVELGMTSVSIYFNTIQNLAVNKCNLKILPLR